MSGWKRGLKDALGLSFWMFAALAAVTGVVCYVQQGPESFSIALGEDIELILYLLPKLGAALLIASFIQALVPPALISKWLGENSGARGLAVATVAGTTTPGGPMTAFPVVTALRDAGTAQPPLIAYVTAWSTIGLQRVFVWEVPLMGVEFAVIRFVSSMPLGIVAALLSRFVPISTDRPSDDDQ